MVRPVEHGQNGVWSHRAAKELINATPASMRAAATHGIITAGAPLTWDDVAVLWTVHQLHANTPDGDHGAMDPGMLEQAITATATAWMAAQLDKPVTTYLLVTSTDVTAADAIPDELDAVTLILPLRAWLTGLAQRRHDVDHTLDTGPTPPPAPPAAANTLDPTITPERVAALNALAASGALDRLLDLAANLKEV